MNASIITRLVWKEYRTQRAFWLCVAGIGVALQILMSRTLQPAEQGALFLLAMGLAGCFAIGSGAMLFAGEREEGTLDLLRTLPASHGRLLAAKLGFALVATLAMLGVLWGAALVISPGVLPRRNSDISTPVYVLAVGFAGIACLVIATFWSLLARRVINAVCLAAATVFLIQWLTSMSWVGIGMIGIICVAAVPLARQWLTGESYPWLRWGDDQSDTRTSTALREDADSRPSFGRALRRLVWQEWLASKRTILWIAGGASLLLFAAAILAPNYEVAIIGIAPLACGVWAFRGEQELSQYRFLSERGISPLCVWLSKHLVWLPTALVLAAVLLALDLLAIRTANWSLYRTLTGPVHPLTSMFEQAQGTQPGGFAVLAIVWACVNYTIGQSLSLLFRRSALAGVLALLIAAIVGDLVQQCLFLQIPVILAVGPLAATLLAATAVRSRDWLRERHGWIGWLAFAATIVLPTAAMLGATAAYRATEIPDVDPGFSVEEFRKPPSPAALQTAAMYRRALELVTEFPEHVKQSDPAAWERMSNDDWTNPHPEFRAYLDQNKEVISLVLEASRRDECAYWQPSIDLLTWRNVFHRWIFLSRLVHHYGASLQSAGDWDGALDVYLAQLRMSRHLSDRAPRRGNSAEQFRDDAWGAIVRWARAPGQTPERIRRAMELTAADDARMPSLTGSIKMDYVIWSDALEKQPTAILARPYDSDPPPPPPVAAFVLEHIPAERERIGRAIRAMTNQSLKEVEAVEQLLATKPEDAKKLWSQDVYRRPWSWEESIPILKNNYWPNDGFTVSDHAGRAGARPRISLQRQVRLALAAWKAEHGTYPEHLDALVGTYFDTLPVDPIDRRMFEYGLEDDNSNYFLR